MKFLMLSILFCVSCALKAQDTGVLIVEYTREGCGPCKLLWEVLSKIEGIKISKIDAPPEVTYVPVLVFYKDGKAYRTLSGYVGEVEIRKVINEAP